MKIITDKIAELELGIEKLMKSEIHKHIEVVDNGEELVFNEYEFDRNCDNCLELQEIQAQLSLLKEISPIIEQEIINKILEIIDNLIKVHPEKISKENDAIIFNLNLIKQEILNSQHESEKEQGNFQPTLETQKKSEQLYDRKKGAVIPDNQLSADNIQKIKDSVRQEVCDECKKEIEQFETDNHLRIDGKSIRSLINLKRSIDKIQKRETDGK